MLRKGSLQEPAPSHRGIYFLDPPGGSGVDNPNPKVGPTACFRVQGLGSTVQVQGKCELYNTMPWDSLSASVLSCSRALVPLCPCTCLKGSRLYVQSVIYPNTPLLCIIVFQRWALSWATTVMAYMSKIYFQILPGVWEGIVTRPWNRLSETALGPADQIHGPRCFIRFTDLGFRGVWVGLWPRKCML